MTNKTETLVKVKDVVKTYGDIVALDHVNLEIYSGEILGLLGPNGSGKSTLIKVIAGLLKPDKGEVYINGYSPLKNPIEVRKLIGYVPEEVVLYESLSVREFFEFIARARELDPSYFKERLTKFINALGLNDRLDDLIGSLSKGNKQKVAIIAALLHDPTVLLLDEPIMGLDPISAKIFKEYLLEIRSQGKAILFSTHILEIAEKMCDRIAVIYKGKIIAEGTIDELKSEAKVRGTLEDVFLQVTGKSGEVSKIVEALREM